MSKPYGIRAECPICKKLFPVEYRSGHPLEASDPKVARHMMDGLKQTGEMTYVFDKALGLAGRTVVPEDFTCPRCRAVHRRISLTYHPYSVEADTKA